MPDIDRHVRGALRAVQRPMSEETRAAVTTVLSHVDAIAQTPLSPDAAAIVQTVLRHLHGAARSAAVVETMIRP